MNQRVLSFLGWLSCGVTLFIWGVTFASTRILLFDFSALEIQIIRFGIAAVLLYCVELIVLRGERYTFKLRDEMLCLGMGLTGVAIYQFLENCAIYYTSASNVAILVSFGPIITAIFAQIFTNEKRLSLALVVGSLISISGVALVSLNGIIVFKMRPLGDLMAVMAMISWGVYSILMKKMNECGFPQIVVVRKSFFWALMAMLPFAIWGITNAGYYALDGSFSITLDATINGERFSSLINWVNILFLGLFASAVCFVLWCVAIKCLGVVRTTVSLYLTPVIGVLFATFCLDEPITVMSILGGCIIILGVVFSNCKLRKRYE
jgi:drug/metabolite transporter (DMT)-like permease